MKNNDWDIPKRDFKIEIFTGRAKDKNSKQIKKNTYLSKLILDNKINFDTSASVSGGVNELNLNITGLTVSKLEEMATCCSCFADPIILNRVEIYAGYGNNSGLIFAGNITGATPNTNNANYSISIKAIAGFNEMINTIKNYSFSGEVSVLAICQQFAKDLGFVLLQGENINNIFINNYYYENHSIVDNIRYLANITGLDIYIDYNSLIVKKKSQPVKNYKTFIVDKYNLIGAIRPNDRGCECDIRLNPFIKTGMLVNLKNTTYPTMNNSDYVIMTYSHHGDTKGNKWQTTLQLIKRSIYGK